MKKRKMSSAKAVISILLLALAVCLMFSAMIGRFTIRPGELWQLLTVKITGAGSSITDSAETVLWKVRLPRILAAVIIGGALSASGASYQGVFKNPMVSPDILGASAGASFGAALAILIGLNSFLVQVLSFIFGLAAVLTAFLMGSFVGKAKGGTALVLILTGMVVSALFSAFVSVIKYVADPYDTLPAITFWLMGGLTYTTASDAVMLLIPLALGFIPLFLLRWRLNVLSFGDEEANALGVNTTAVRGVVVLCATLLTSSSVAIGGMIGWVGLIVPHLARMLAGPNYKRLLPVSFLMGGLFLILVDDIARCAFAQELPLGILTACVGAPFFLLLLTDKRRSFL